MFHQPAIRGLSPECQGLSLWQKINIDLLHRGQSRNREIGHFFRNLLFHRKCNFFYVTRN